MLRRFNYTQRETIKKGDAEIELRVVEDNQPMFNIELKLDSYKFRVEHPDARVRLEAWRSNISERWDLGIVSNLTIPPEHERRMREAPISSQFKVIVVAGDDSGRLLGASQPIRPKLPRGSMLPVRFDDLKDEVWRVDFGDGDQPELLVNSQIEMINEIVRSDAQFRALVMPQVLRAVLTQIVLFESVEPDDDESPGISGWFNLAQGI